MEGNYLTYKSRPVVRCGNTIYYGSMRNRCVVMLMIQEQTPDHGVPLATRIKCYLTKTDTSLPLPERIVKNAERQTLYDAMELAAAWLKKNE